MANTVNLKIKISDDGSLSVTAKNAEKAAAATEKLGKSTDKTSRARNKYSKGEKGVAGATSNSTKAFSKMRNSMTGEGGLVPAYATLAANVFAVTAAFGILQRSAAVKQLEEGLIFTGRAAGQNLPFLVESLKEITGAALSTADAMRAVAVGVSAGFSQTQLEGLTKVAKGASLALGRDMTDAMDRLVRGAAKLEPEILDELGIMVRLDEASENFATSIGKTANELTQFEKRMAFTNAIITQGEIKFGALAKVIDPNPYDQLAATFDNLTKSAVNLFNTVLGPVIEVLGSNMLVLTGGIAALGGGVVRQMVPALTQGGQAMADLATEAANAGKANLKSLKSFQGAPKVFNELVDSVADGTASLKDRKRLLDSLDRSEQKHINTMDEQIKKHGKESKTIKEKEAKLEGVQLARQSLTETTKLETKATILDTRAKALNQASQGQLITSLRTLRGAFIAEAAATQASTASKTAAARSLALLKVGFANAAVAARAFGIAILNMIPGIGQALIILGIVLPMLAEFFKKPPTALQTAIAENEDRLSDLSNVVAQLGQTYATSTSNSERFFAVLNSSTGIVQGATDAMSNLMRKQIADNLGKQFEIQRKIAAAVQERSKAQAALNKADEKQIENGRSLLDLLVTPVRVPGAGVSPYLNAETASFERATEKIENLNEKLKEVQSETVIDQALTAEAMGTVLTGTVAALKTSKAVTAALGAGAEEIQLLDERILAMQTIASDLATGSITVQQAQDAMLKFNLSVKKTKDSADSASDAINKLKQNFLDTSKTGGKFGDIIDDANVVLLKLRDGNFAAIIEKYAEAFKLLGVAKGNVDALAAAIEQMIDVNQRLLELPIEEQLSKIATATARRGGLEISALNEELRLNQLKTNLLTDQLSIAARQGDSTEVLRIQAELLALHVERLKTINKEETERNRLLGLRTGAESAVGAAAASANIEMPANATLANISSEHLASLREGFQGLIGDLAKLGPEGEVMAAVTQGAFLMTESFTAAFEGMENGAIKAADGIAIAATAINAMASIQSAQGKAAVAAIDKEIAAEKKRDGQSAASLAKLQSLQKKKEATERKNFEREKKMKMASIVASTAVGIMKAYEQGGVLGFITGSIIAAIGAMQLATVSGTSYDGGGNIGGSGNPTSISMGQRRNSVDLAKSQSSRGELAYMRGERGSGGPENFRSAFSGYRNRAEGGNTGLIVGEQGPELFVPEVPGRVVPNDDIEAGAATNVSFNINTIDASGVEDMLLNQQGNIIGMIRQAANSYGQDFVEEVDTMTLAPNSTGAVSRY